MLRRSMRRLRKLLVTLLVILVVLGVAALVAWRVVRAKIRSEVESRCAAALKATCTVDDIVLEHDGASAVGVHVQASGGLVSTDITRIDAKFDWLTMLRGRQQDVSVFVDAPVVQNEIPVGDAVFQLRRMDDGLTPDGTPSKVRLTKLEVDHGDVRVRVSLVADIHIDRVRVHWSHAGATILEWDDAVFETLIDKKSTGACSVRIESRSPKAAVTCPKLKTTFDIEKVKGLADLAKLFLKVKI